jgi:hypothetical protein
VRREDRGATPEPLADALVFHRRALPAGAVTAGQLTENWIAAARRQLTAGGASAPARALRHAIGIAEVHEGSGFVKPTTLLLAGGDAAGERELAATGLAVRRVAFTPFDSEAASKIRHFETYNRTRAGQRVADIVAAARKHPGAVLVAGADAGLEALLAAAVAHVRLAVIDAGRFDPSTDAAFVERLYIPGLRRAGGLETAAAMVNGRLVVHNAGSAFKVPALATHAEPLAPGEIVKLIQELR